MKKIIISVGVFLGIVALAYLYFFKISVNAKTNAINAVPANAVFIIDIENPFEQWSKITEGKIWQYLKTNEALSEIGNKIDSLNTGLKNNEFLWDLIASRPISVSAHKIRKNEFDLLYVIDVTKASSFAFIKDYLESLVGRNMKVTKRDYNSIEIVELNFKGESSLLYLYVYNNLIVISSTHVLIENSIDQLEEPIIARDLDFIEVSKLVDDDGVNIYLQHSYFKEYVSKWVKDEESESFEYLNSLIYSAVSIAVDERYISLSGYSNITDSLQSYAQVIHNSGKSKVGMQSIVPENSLFFLSMGFDSFSEFYKNLELRITTTEDAELYVKNKKKLEKYLNISVEDDLISWIGDEAGILQIHPAKKNGVQGYAFVLKVKDIDLAKEKLAFIKSQVKRKTPIKFKGIEYKGHEINFLSIKGMFKVLLGNMFSKLEKPYYTIIDDYVVFSNHPGTLAQLITYKLEGKTLEDNEQFGTYFNQFDRQSSLYLYLNSKQVVSDSKEYLSNEYWEALNKNKSYIESFPIVGIQIKPEGRLLETSIIINYMPAQEMVDWNQLFIPLPELELDTVVQNQPQKEEEIQIDDIFPEDLNDKKLTENYANGQLRFEVSLKNGLKEGAYKEYDSLGNVITKGRYKKNKKTGSWKYYNSEGNLLRKEKF